jgi:two-component system response regulator AtoC
MVSAGTFREDLFQRLNVVPVLLPPLRERRADIAPLARLFCANCAREYARPKLALDPTAIALLEAQVWKGNVRQLQNFIERLAVLTPGDVLSAVDVQRELDRDEVEPRPVRTEPLTITDKPLEQRRNDAERTAIIETLRSVHGNCTRGALVLGISRRTLYNKLEALGIQPSDYKR